MTIKTTTELVRYIRHHIAGSEWEDEKAVDAYVNLRTKELVQRVKELEDALETVRELRRLDQETIDRLKDPTE